MDYEIQKNYCIRGDTAVFLLLLDIIVLSLSFLQINDIRIIVILFLCNYCILFANGFRFGKKFLVSPICLFFIFFFFYANTFPFLFEFGGMNFFSVKESYLLYTYSYSLRFLSFAVFIFSLAPNLFIIDLSSINIIRQDITFIIVFIAIALFFLEIVFFVWSGYLSFFLSGTTSRTDINTYVRHYNLWIYLGYLDIYILLKLFFANRGRSIRKLLMLLPVTFYYGVSIFSGSRKQLLYVIVIIVICYFLKIIKIKKTYLFILLLLFFSAVFYRSIIMDKGFQGNIFSKIAGLTGEFIFPTITFPLSLQKDFGRSNFNYPTIFDGVLYFVPRAIFPIKNYSIGETFSRMMDVNMGFAMNPMLEAYINFGQFGYVFEAFLLLSLFQFIKKLANKNFFLYTFSMIFLIDLNRGEIAFYIRQIFTIIITLYFITVFIQFLSYAFRFNRKEYSL